MMKWDRKAELAIIVLVAAFIMFFQLGHLPLLDPDEPVYAQTAREMLQTGDFISPRIYGDFWYDKPPMYYWLVAGSFKLFGQSEFAARFPSALLAVCGVLLVYRFGKSIFGRRAGLIAALVLATSVEYFYLGKAAVTDITLTFFMTASLLLYLKGRYYPAYAAAGLAVLTKGPVAIVLPAAIVLAHLIWTKGLGEIKRLKLVSGTLLMLLVASPWYLAMYHFHGMDFVDTFLGFHNVTRFLKPEHPSGTLWYYYIPVLLLGFFPWTVFLGQAGKSIWQERKGLVGRELSFLAIWAGAVFVFFSLSQTKLISYILPMYPPLALLTGWYINHCISREAVQGVFGKPVILLLLFFGLLEGGLVWGALAYLPALVPGVVLTGLVFGLMAAGAWLAVKQGRAIRLVGVLTGGMLLFVAVLMSSLFPAAAPVLSVKEVAADFKAQYDGQAPVYVEKFLRPGFAYYTEQPGEELTSINQVLTEMKNASRPIYFVVKEKNYRSLPPAAQQQLQLVAAADNVVVLRKE